MSLFISEEYYAKCRLCCSLPIRSECELKNPLFSLYNGMKHVCYARLSVLSHRHSSSLLTIKRGAAQRRLHHRHSSTVVREIRSTRIEETVVLGGEFDVVGIVGSNSPKSKVGLSVLGDLVGRSVVVVLLPLLRTGDLVRVVGGEVRCGLEGVMFGLVGVLFGLGAAGLAVTGGRVEGRGLIGFGVAGLAVTGGRVEGRGLTVGGAETGGFVTKTHSGGTLAQ
jgi:hypothetical protein